MYNRLEPPALVRHFLYHPPRGFAARPLAGGVPAFAAEFDLLTTVDTALRRRLERLPLAGWWQPRLRPRTLFLGATVTEYALLPEDTAPAALVEALVRADGEFPFVILKDLPTGAELVDEKSLAASRAVVDAAVEAGFVVVEGQALAWMPVDFSSLEEYFARMPRPRRKEFRQKLRSAERLQVEEIPTGDARLRDAGFLDLCYRLYRDVYDQSDVKFDLLTPEFFVAVLQDPEAGGTLFVYRAGGDLVGWNLCFVHEGRLVDKWIGFAYPQAREHDLYFVSWFRNLDYALRKGLKAYVAGWTDPEVKRRLGARFAFTQHAVFVRNPLLRNALRPFKRLFESDRHWHATAGRP